MSADRYRATLHRWAGQYVPEGAQVIDVTIDYDEGWDPTYGEATPSLTATITYRNGDRQVATSPEATDVLRTLGELLHELFAIEDGDR